MLSELDSGSDGLQFSSECTLHHCCVVILGKVFLTHSAIFIYFFIYYLQLQTTYYLQCKNLQYLITIWGTYATTVTKLYSTYSTTLTVLSYNVTYLRY